MRKKSAPAARGQDADARRLTALEEKIKREPDSIDAYLEMAALMSRRREPGMAAQLLRTALDRAPRHLGLLTNLGGLLASASYTAEEGIGYLRQVVEQMPRSYLSHYNLAIGLKTAGQFAESATQFRFTLDLKPDFADALVNLGHVLLELGKVAEAAEAYETALPLRRAPGLVSKAPIKTNAAKLRHDIEQLRHLLGLGLLDSQFEAMIADFEAALADLPPLPNGLTTVDLPEPHRARLAPIYNRLLHRHDGTPVAAGAVNPELDRVAIEQSYGDNAPGYAWFDGLLTPAALRELRDYCLQSTIWFQCRYGDGYLGAFMDDGFCCPLLLQIADELRQALPGIFAQHTLRRLWAFKYDSRMSGIPIHADFAAVNVNFWVTPDEANLDKDSGGLIVWNRRMPPDWELWRYKDDIPAIREYLSKNRAKSLGVPYRQNRAVMFNSDLFHETAKLNFREGYENRRINITMLFGRRENN
ncbi:MAG TPA: tetratricopeptide repeat protein [Verrucomicrobiae bacterium]|nr:tetratricopeptide repeat protein [Verrucomicrobiae bacterium]